MAFLVRSTWSCALEAQICASFSISCLGFEPASSRAYLCIQMARATKRLRRKTTISQKGCSEMMILTSEWWMQFLFAVGRYISAAQDFPRYRVWRLLSKAWREVWDQGFRLKVQLLEAHYYNLRFAGRCSDDLVFRRDSCNKIYMVLAYPAL